MQIEVLNECEYKKVIPQPDLEIVKSLDQLYEEKAQYESAIINNQTMLDEVMAEIAQVEDLGIVTRVEAEEVKAEALAAQAVSEVVE